MRWMAKLVWGLVATGLSLVSAHEASACEGGPDGPAVNVSRSFPSGAAWSFDVSIAPCEGLVLSKVRYTPSGGTARMVIDRATLAEVHVPYDNSAARFLDVTDSTSGLGASAIPLTAEECEGEIHNGTICVEDEEGGYRWKFDTAFAKAHAVAVSVASQLGNYTYINRWVFEENGTIEPAIGLTGRLQLISFDPSDAPQFGSRLSPPGAEVAVGLNHMHNFYYRLDFDVDGAGNDVVSRIAYTPSSSEPRCGGNACGKTSFTVLEQEAAEQWSAIEQVSWLIQDTVTTNLDRRRIGYEIKPHYSGIWRGMTDGSEPWAQHELFVTRYDVCERFAVRNVAPYLGAQCAPTSAPDVSAMVDGQATNGQDLVVWFVNRHHHVTRDEDEVFMPIEWTGFHISPRSFSDSNPAP